MCWPNVQCPTQSRSVLGEFLRHFWSRKQIRALQTIFYWIHCKDARQSICNYISKFASSISTNTTRFKHICKSYTYPRFKAFLSAQYQDLSAAGAFGTLGYSEYSTIVSSGTQERTRKEKYVRGLAVPNPRTMPASDWCWRRDVNGAGCWNRHHWQRLLQFAQLTATTNKERERRNNERMNGKHEALPLHFHLRFYPNCHNTHSAQIFKTIENKIILGQQIRIKNLKGVRAFYSPFMSDRTILI